MIYLYTREECEACTEAKRLVFERWGLPFREVQVDNPLLELGIQMLFKDGQVHTPVIVVENVGIYILTLEPYQLVRLVSLKAEE